MVLAVVGLAVTARAEDYRVAGDWNGWDNTIDVMTDNGDGTWSATITGLTPGSRQEFKFYEDWDMVWVNTDGNGSNNWLYADAEGSVTVGLNTNTVSDGWLTTTNRTGMSTDGAGTGWVIAGSFGGAGLPDWSTTGLPMDDMGGGMYELTLYLPAGSGADWVDPGLNSYAWKAVAYDSWDSISEDGRGVNTQNAVVTVDEENEYVTFYLDAHTGVVRTEVIPEPATIALLGLGLALIRRKR